MEFKNPAVTADVIFERKGCILLTKRSENPFKGKWGIPGGHIQYGEENLKQTAVREFKEETGLIALNLKLFNVYSSPNRDPRGHHITIVYIAKNVKGKIKAGGDAGKVKFFSLSSLPDLAFDHEKIIKDYIAWKKRK